MFHCSIPKLLKLKTLTNIGRVKKLKKLQKAPEMLNLNFFFCQIYFCHSEEKLDPLISEEGAYMALLIIASYGKVVRQYVGSCVWYMFDGIYTRTIYVRWYMMVKRKDNMDSCAFTKSTLS